MSRFDYETIHTPRADLLLSSLDPLALYDGCQYTTQKANQLLRLAGNQQCHARRSAAIHASTALLQDALDRAELLQICHQQQARQTSCVTVPIEFAHIPNHLRTRFGHILCH